MNGSETCDDGVYGDGDGCSILCQVEAYSTCPTPPASGKCTVCGDGVVNGTEACDDGDVLDTNGCNSTCKVTANSVCPIPPLAGPCS